MAYFRAYIIHYHEPTCFAKGEAKHALTSDREEFGA